MKQKIIMSLALLCLFVLQAGCGVDDTVYLEQTESGTEHGADYRERDAKEDRAEAKMSGTEGISGDSQKEDEMHSAGKDAAGDPAQNAGKSSAGDTEVCYVYVCGAVCVPGVYALRQGSRIYEALALAGGLTEEASAASVNQAEPVRDGQMIYIPTEEEIQKGIELPEGNVTAADGTAPEDAVGSGENSDSNVDVDSSANVDSNANVDSRVDLNTATVSELMTLPGIGQTKAERILAYREAHGEFSSVEEIMNVDGIKEGVYNRIKDNIKVK